MPTKTRSSKRLVRLPVKYNDHVMMNSNQIVDQNRSYEKDHYSGDDRMGIGDLGKECDENVSPMLNKGVFGSKENDNSMGSDMNVEDENVGDTSGSHKESNCENNIGNEEGIKENMPNKTYASAVHKNKQSIDTSLEFRPTVTDDEGCEFVIFDEELVSHGSKKNFDDNGGCFFKFKNEEGMEKVIEQGPWIVNHKPLFVQKWDPIIGLERKEENKIPIWAKLKNVPPEAWTRDGISALASSLGKPLRMDNITAQACQTGRGRATFARVLVEFDVKKGYKDEIGIQYMSKDKIVKEEEVLDENTELKQLKDRMIVDHYLNEKIQPTCSESQNWSKDMIAYFKLKWEEDRLKEMEDIEDVMGSENMCAKKCSADENHFIYAANCGMERRILWNDLEAASSIVLNKPWTMLGLQCYDESGGAFSWTRRAFRFNNYVVNKEEFIPTVKEVWKKEVQGHHMYRVVQKLKAIKYPMRKLNWKNGNLAEKVELCRGKLKDAQEKMVGNPCWIVNNGGFYVCDEDGEVLFVSGGLNANWMCSQIFLEECMELVAAYTSHVVPVILHQRY
ncbi:RNA-directed DNA polymerase, eukaryota, reverse transcriptase zinc-binding domain protein [Tanacetum coccineum]